MAFVDGNNGENFISEGLIPAPHTLVFYCPIHKKSLEPQECFDCGMFINGNFVSIEYWIESKLRKK